MNKPKQKDYAVGYAKPPEHTRFQAGQSGNPKGRPKGSLSLAGALNRALKEKVVVIENGRRKTITKLDATVKALVNSAVKGDSKARQQLLGLSPLVGMEPVVATAHLDATDTAVLAGLVQRLGTTTGKPETPSKARKPAPTPKVRS